MKGPRTLSIAVRMVLLAGLQLLLVIVFFTLRRSYADLPYKRNAILQVRFHASEIMRRRENGDALREQLERIHEELGHSVAIYGPHNEVIATAGGSPRLEPPKEIPAHGEVDVIGSGPSTFYIRISDDPVEVMALVPPSYAIPFGDYAVVGGSLLMMALTSGLFAIGLLRALRRLSSAAHAFGRGDLTARAGLRRKDELGNLSQNFDEMAARIQTLVSNERELLANVSHELRTPLARIRVALDIASEHSSQNELEGIAGDLSELERLVEDVLAASKLDSSRVGGVPPLRREGVASEDVVRSAVEHFTASHRGRTLEVSLPEQLPRVSADRMLLRRAIDNLLDNASKYSDPGTAVSLRARVESAQLVVEIEDRGIGIDPEDLPRLFTPFFRTDRSRARKTGGVGLGLALSKRITEAHGGTLALTSSPGLGTVARMTVPVQ